MASAAHGVSGAQLGLVVSAMVLWSVISAVAVLDNANSLVVAADVAIVGMICAIDDVLLPSPSDHVDWTILLAIGSLLAGQMLFSASGGLVVCAVLASAQHLGGASAYIVAMLMAQGAVTAVLVHLLNNAVRQVDDAVTRVASAYVQAVIAAAVRADQDDYQRRLHDTGLATLTMVAAGAVTESSAMLRQRAAADLSTLQSAGDRTVPEPDLSDSSLDLALRTLESTWVPGLPPLRIDFDLVPTRLPHHVVMALTEATAEALTNVARHSGSRTATVSVRERDDGIEVSVRDGGRGFDTRLVPLHRRGLRGSIVDRMAAVGGTAEVQSGRDRGTIVTMRWWHARGNG
ncbi:sensor histidine kinase [Lentzea sp. CA-135723]|uniref:sensor histidine kinase n=1 Tax=Lentzea sp. CA-135723 TaxID=3239950 RepID=UPI003D92180D